VQRGLLPHRSSIQTVFSSSGVRKEVNAMLQQLETSAHKLGKSMDETLLTVVQSRAAIKLMPAASAALAAIGQDSRASEVAAPLSPPPISACRVNVCVLFAADCPGGLGDGRSSRTHSSRAGDRREDGAGLLRLVVVEVACVLIGLPAR
jgi:hypothetical protein